MKQKRLSLYFLSLSFLFNPFAEAEQTSVASVAKENQELYPSLIQTLIETSIFEGDRHGNFEGDLLATFSDGSVWKIHPQSRITYESWHMGDRVRIRLRTEFYWFKREHKFEIYNYDNGQTVKAMLIKHKVDPYTLRVVATETYSKSTKQVTETEEIVKVKDDGSIKTEYVTRNKRVPSDFRKVIRLNDGSTWVIKENLNDVQLGSRVYIGAQGKSRRFYDYLIITGDQREAVATLARQQK